MLNQHTEAGRKPSTSPQSDRAGFRPDIQALRALAVAAVVVNHLWPTRLTGGYVGVDIFFVISGYLISAHLVREIDRTGRINVLGFYARRARRLLPAAQLVLVAVVVAAFFLIPRVRWAPLVHEVIASVFYWENWSLTTEFWPNPVNFYKLTAVTHYWTLSVEEQFYLCWPFFLLLLFKLKKPWARFAGLAAVGVASLVLCVHLTTIAPGPVYFVTPIRIWEFAIGTAIAMLHQRLVLPRPVAEAASLLGLAAILGSAVFFTATTEFPGAIALIPALGTGLFIVAGTRPGRQWHTFLTSSAPVQFLGDISYSLYLWHFPIVVLVPFALSTHQLSNATLGGIAVASLLLAFLSKRLIEDPVRRSPRLVGSTALTFAAALAGTVVVCLTATLLLRS
ncbi:acyltransferase family protein [Kitasatospora sp. NPDC001540]|uniref:acyltransferase family protein n=1 Tax=Kitasatospora sp. NPDC001540 TaxID=3364014 RepID=UPI00369AD1D8